jgi:hypothetical protein
MQSSRIRKCEACVTANAVCRGIEGYTCDRCKRLKRRCGLSTKGPATGTGKAERKGKSKAGSPKRAIIAKQIPRPVRKSKLRAGETSTSKRTLTDVEADTASERDEGIRRNPFKRPRIGAEINEHMQAVWDMATETQRGISAIADGLTEYIAEIHMRLTHWTTELNRLRANQAHIFGQLDMIGTKLDEMKRK